MVAPVVRHDHVCVFHGPVMPDPVLLHGFGVENSDLDRPHAGHNKQYNLITPEIPPEQQVEVLSERQRRSPPPSLIFLNLDAVS